MRVALDQPGDDGASGDVDGFAANARPYLTTFDPDAPFEGGRADAIPNRTTAKREVPHGHDSTHPWHHERVTSWFDTHVHLDRYAAPEREALLAHAAARDVRVLAVGVDLESSRAALGLAGSCREVFGATAGVHPLHAASWVRDELGSLAAGPRVLAIGECGFDDANPDWPAQQDVFRPQCDLARRLGKPIIIHVDGPRAWEELVACGDELDGLRVVRHYFTGDSAQAAWHQSRGHYLSFGNPLRREAGLRQIARAYPAELLLVETDSYPLANRNTEPAHVVRVAETLALLRDWTFDEAREILAANTRAAFQPS